MRSTLALTLTLAAAAASAAPAGVRSLFLNGIDISSARSQDLKNVDVHINDAGDVFIIAPHYQVNEEDTYIPLSKYVQDLNQTAHKAPQGLGDEAKVGGAQRPDAFVPAKEGELVSPPAATGQVMPEHARPVPATDKPAAGGEKAAPVNAPAGDPAATESGEVPKAADPAPVETSGEKG